MIFEWIDGFYKKNNMGNLPKLEENRREVVFDRELPWKDDTFVLELLNSGEDEAKYAKLGESIYRTRIGAKLIQYASIALRPKSFVKWYLLPQIKEWFKWKNGDKSMKKYLAPTFWGLSFIIFTILVKVIDVQPVGAEGSLIGFAGHEDYEAMT